MSYSLNMTIYVVQYLKDYFCPEANRIECMLFVSWTILVE